ncbi:BACON domain-containing protein [Alistipes indistinctus]
MSWDLARYTSTSSQVASLTGGWNKQFTVTFKANTGYTPVSGTVTVYYPDPANWNNQVWGTLSFTQPAATPDYTLSIAPSNISVDPYGGTQKLKVSYVYMQEAVNLTYLGATGLPAGCTLSAGTNGELTLRCDKNASGTDRNATVTVRYQNPRDAAKPVTASFRMYQATVPSWIAITPESVTVMGAGEEKSFNLQYAVDSTVTYECLGYSGGQGQIRSYRIANNQLYVDFKKNQTNSTISGNITFNFKDPANSALTLSDAVSFSQAPASYAIRLSENSLAMPAAGTTKTLTASYVERDNPVTLTYKSSSGLPPWCTLTPGANGSLSLVCPANTGNAARSATVTVSYNNPLNASQPVTASFSLSQQPLSYNITIPGNSLSVTAKGETKTLSLAYVDRTGTVNLTYKGCTGLPSGATVTANSNGTFSVAFPGNTTSAVRSGTATVSYNNPLNSSQPVSATFT